jgi:molybdate transport system permease protein
MAQAFEAVDHRLVNASSVLGASRTRTFFRIILPLARNGVIVAAVLSFAHTLGEFGVVLMVGGDIPGATRTVSIAIYDDVQALNYAAANTTALALLLVSFLALAVVSAVNRRAWRRPWSVASSQ